MPLGSIQGCRQSRADLEMPSLLPKRAASPVSAARRVSSRRPIAKEEHGSEASNPRIVRLVTSRPLSIARDLSRLVRSRASYAESHPQEAMGAGEPDTGANPPDTRVGAQAPSPLARQLTPQACKG